MHKHSFQYWARRKGLLLKESTVAQLVKLKTKQNPELIKAQRAAKDIVSRHIGIASEQTAAGVAKWYLYQFERPGSGDSTRDGERTFGNWLQRSIENHKDYIAAKLDDKGNLTGDLRSRFNDPKFSTEDLAIAVHMWHEDLAAKTSGGKGAEGETFIDLSKLGENWKGWEWVSLGSRTCSIEGDSMGHCGNTFAPKPGDDILSLRDPEGYPRLTFIVNDGSLGEMKGRANTKPKEEYHPAIVELLKHDEIKQVVGGGYDPVMNFKLDDLDDEIKDELLEDKPDLEVDEGDILDEKIEEINKEHGVSDWKFVGVHGDVDESDGHIYLLMSAWAHTEIQVEWMQTDLQHSIKLTKSGLEQLKGKYPTLRLGEISPSGKVDLSEALNRAVNKVIEKWRDSGDMDYSDGEVNIEPKKDSIVIGVPIDQPQDQYGTNEQNYEEFVRELKNLEGQKWKFDQDVREALVEAHLITPPHSVHATRSWDKTKFNHFDWELDEMDIYIRLKQQVVLAEINPPHIQQQYLRRHAFINATNPGLGMSNMGDGPKIEHPFGIKGSIAEPNTGTVRHHVGWSGSVQNEVKQFKKLIVKEIQSMGERQIQIAKKQRILPGMPQPQYQMKFQHDMSIQPRISIEFDEKSGNVVTMWDLVIKQANEEQEVNEAVAFIEFLDKNFDNVMKRMRDLFQQMVVSKMEFEHGDFDKWRQEEEKYAIKGKLGKGIPA